MNFRIQAWRGQQQPVHRTAAAPEPESSPAQGHINNVFHHGRAYAPLLRSTDGLSGIVQTLSHADDEVLPWSRAQWSPDIRSGEGGWVLNPYLGGVCSRDGAVESLRVAVDISGLSPSAGELSVGAWQGP